MGTSSFGETFARRFGAPTAPSVTATVLRKSDVTATYLCQETPTYEFSEPQPYAEAYLVSMGLYDFPGYTLWEAGRQIPTEPVVAPHITIYDLRAEPYIFVNNRLVGLHFHLPRSMFDVVADHASARRIGDLEYPHGSGIDDPTMYHLGMSLMPAFQNPQWASRLFVESVTTAIGAHIGQRYGGLRFVAPRRRGLAAWQERAAVEMLDANLDGDIPLASIAARCRLSPSHFARAFRQSTGLPPHRWLLQRRIEKAKGALRDSPATLADIATSCGFADQSHFTRVFTKLVGVSPGEWRRRH